MSASGNPWAAPASDVVWASAGANRTMSKDLWRSRCARVSTTMSFDQFVTRMFESRQKWQQAHTCNIRLTHVNCLEIASELPMFQAFYHSKLSDDLQLNSKERSEGRHPR